MNSTHADLDEQHRRVAALAARRLPTSGGIVYDPAIPVVEGPQDDPRSTSDRATPPPKVTAETTPVSSTSTLNTLRLNHLEESDQKVAFEMYWDLKETRSYSELSRILGISVPVLEQWSATYGWEKEIQTRSDTSMMEKLQERSLYDVLKLNNELIVSLQERLEKHREAMAATTAKDRTAKRDYLLSANDYVRLTKLLMELKGAVVGLIPKKLGVAVLILDAAQAQARIDAYDKRVSKVTVVP